MASRAYTHVKNLQEIVEDPSSVGYSPTFAGPNTPSIVTPAAGATSQGAAFVLSAYSHPNGVPQAGIQIERATNSDFTTGLITSPIAATTSATAALTPGGLTPGVTYYARARYIDIFGQPSAYSAVSSFVATVNPEVSAQARSGSANAANHSLTFTGCGIGDLIVIAVAANTAPTTPTGFTAHSNYANVLSGSAAYVYYKVATVNNEAVTVSISGAGECAGVSLRYATGFPGSTMFAQAKAGGTSFATNVPSAGTGKWSIVMGFCRSPSPTITMPAGGGWTTIYNLSTQSGSTYFTPLIAWTASLAAGTITRGSATYETWHMTLSF